MHSISASRQGAIASWLGGIAVAAAMAAYYLIFYFPPRLVGSNEPDRYYHLGLSRLVSLHGILRTLPQADDLDWGRYFPDKEFGFHALTGAIYWLAGPVGVQLLVPVLGALIVICLYVTMLQPLPAWKASVLSAVGILLSPVLVFRLSLLRPHLLAILFFCLLLFAILRGRKWLAAIAAAGFALSYHAFYIPLLVIAIAACFRWPHESGGARRWQWALAGLLLGILLNPYFPSNLVMSWTHVVIALGRGLPPGMQSGNELLPLEFLEYLDFFGFLPVALLAITSMLLLRRFRPAANATGFWFLYSLAASLVLLSFKSSRATEYAVPAVLLLVAYLLGNSPGRLPVAGALAVLLACQGHSSIEYYSDSWSRPQDGNAGWFIAAAQALPANEGSKKVFNCEWEAGSYILFARPRMRFVDLLEPAFLWRAHPDRYLERVRLAGGHDGNPLASLVNTFHADFVLCGASPLNRQLLADPAHFQPLEPAAPTGPLMVFRIRK